MKPRGNPEKIKGKGFDKFPEHINRKGPPKKTINVVNIELEAQGYICATPRDITDVFLRLINLPISELTNLIKDDTQPVLVRTVGKAILSGKGFDIIDKMLDRAIGKAISKTDLTTNGKDINSTPTIIFKDYGAE